MKVAWHQCCLVSSLSAAQPSAGKIHCDNVWPVAGDQGQRIIDWRREPQNWISPQFSWLHCLSQSGVHRQIGGHTIHSAWIFSLNQSTIMSLAEGAVPIDLVSWPSQSSLFDPLNWHSTRLLSAVLISLSALCQHHIAQVLPRVYIYIRYLLNGWHVTKEKSGSSVLNKKMENHDWWAWASG